MSQISATAPALTPTPAPESRRGVGLSLLALVGLAALSVPRIVAHDLGLLPPGSPFVALLALVPALVWVVVATVYALRPLPALLVVGGFYGVALAVVHNLTWSRVFGDDQPRLGGNLDGAFSPMTEEVLMRGATTLSSLVTGVALGLVCGLLAWAAQALGRRSGARLPIR